MINMKRFLFDTILNQQDICNLKKEQEKIQGGVSNGLKMLVYGKRNTGKTSVVKNIIAKNWLKKHSSGFYMYVDLMGVRQLSQISERMTVSFMKAYNNSFRMKAVFQNMLEVIKEIKPVFEMDERGQLKLSFGASHDSRVRSFRDILQQLDLIYQSGIPVLLILDEFQDIALIEEAEAKFRESLESIDANIPVIILGSKQHLLTQVFAKPKAPFFNWGTHVNFGEIDYQDYCEYMNERFKPHGLSISQECSTYLQNRMSRTPEAINRLCYALLIQYEQEGAITQEMVDNALQTLISDRQAEPERYLSSFTLAEQRVLIELARREPLQKPQSKTFTALVNLSAAGVRKILIKFENDAVIYHDPSGYVLADPLLKEHIRMFRL